MFNFKYNIVIMELFRNASQPAKILFRSALVGSRKASFEVGVKPQIFFAHITNLTTRSPDLPIKSVKAWDDNLAGYWT